MMETETYQGWTITTRAEENMCANYSFTVTDPAGRAHHVKMGGDNRQRARERAREMIDMELALRAEE